jgi:glycosyltransferase involved in cell wall biosynthesis
MNLIMASDGVRQPQIYEPASKELYVAIASLSLGGAERIVLDWVERIHPRWHVHLVVLRNLRNRSKEWPVPNFVRVTRLGGVHIMARLAHIGKIIAGSKNAVCLCHLLSTKERRALQSSGAICVPVFHNAKGGWKENVQGIVDAPYAIAVSQACAEDLRFAGWQRGISVIRHVPRMPHFSENVRERMRRAWNIPQGAIVIGMLGALKPQKNYPFALSVFQRFLESMDAYLVIVGGPVNTGIGRKTWDDVVAEVYRLGLRSRVAMPGFVPNAAAFLPVFDIILNTSHFEGLSMATLESLLSGLPVVASKVGGQGELSHDQLILVSLEKGEDAWAEALHTGLRMGGKKPAWAGFPSYRLWTLASIARHIYPSSGTLFVTANLSSGGAQRSLVNVSKALQGRLTFEIMVVGKSTSSHFFQELEAIGVQVMRAAELWDVFDFAEGIVDRIVQNGFETVCFWNVDPRVKLLVVKSLEFTGLRFVDVSPGARSFEEMKTCGEFQHLIAFTEEQYHKRLDALVLKYRAPVPRECSGKAFVIRNGVPAYSYKTDYTIRGAPRIVISGRIAPTKFILEILAAMRILWTRMEDVELHVIGAAEHYNEEYLDEVIRSIGWERNRRIFLYGARFDAPVLLQHFDAYVVLGEHQGCPNALLEALVTGLPVVGNDDGGTGEQIIDMITGLLIKGRSPELLSNAIERLLRDRVLARRLGTAGRQYVLREFSLERMAEAYEQLLCSEAYLDKRRSLNQL